jgi:hypothetical protein
MSTETSQTEMQRETSTLEVKEGGLRAQGYLVRLCLIKTVTKTKSKTNKNHHQTEQNIQELWDNFKRCNTR